MKSIIQTPPSETDEDESILFGHGVVADVSSVFVNVVVLHALYAADKEPPAEAATTVTVILPPRVDGSPFEYEGNT